MVYFAYGSDLDGMLRIARGFFLVLPAFQYSKMYGDISLKSSNHYDLLQNRWVSVYLNKCNDREMDTYTVICLRI